MRLTSSEIATIKDIIHAVDSNAEIYLYGSRVDDTKRGGDIDLLVKSNVIDFGQKLTLSSRLFDALGEQKVDVLIPTNNNAAFADVAMENAIKL